MNNKIYSLMFHKAVDYAAIKHFGQWRKHPVLKIPYIAHPFAVAMLLSRAGFDEDVTVAGLLHDVIEDCGISKEELAGEFNPHIAQLVFQVSEQNKSLNWKERKTAYQRNLETAEPGALAVAVADHLHNARSILRGMENGESMAGLFYTSLEDKLQNELVCLKIFERLLPGELTREFAEALDELSKKLV